MVQAAAAGITPLQAEAMTVGEIMIVIEGYAERERRSLISRISAILRALSKKGNPFKGLIPPKESKDDGKSAALALRRVLGRKTGAKPVRDSDTKHITQHWLWTNKRTD